MNARSILPFLVTLFSIISGFAQCKIAFSPEIKLRSTSDFFQVVGTWKDTTVLVYQNDNDYVIQRFDAEMKRVDATAFTPIDVREPKVFGVVADKVSFTLLFSHNKQGRTHLCGAHYRCNVKLDTIVTYIILEAREDFNANTYLNSEDHSKVLVWYMASDDDFSMYAIDLENKKNLWRTRIDAGKGEDYKAFQEILFSNVGTAFLVYPKGNDRGSRETAGFGVLSYDGQALNTQFIRTRGFLWTVSRFEVDNLNGRVVGAGLCSPNTNVKASHVFYLSASISDKDSSIFTTTPFTTELVTSVTGRNPKRHKNNLADMLAHDLVLRRDGGVLFITEQFRQYTRQSVQNTTSLGYSRMLPTQFSTDYYYDNLALFSLNPDGRVQWMSALAKRQSSQDDIGIFSSYGLLKGRNGLHLIYNDDIKPTANIFDYTLSPQGTYTRTSLMSSEKDNLYIRCRNAKQTSASLLIVPAERRGGELKLVRFEF